MFAGICLCQITYFESAYLFCPIISYVNNELIKEQLFRSRYLKLLTEWVLFWWLFFVVVFFACVSWLCVNYLKCQVHKTVSWTLLLVLGPVWRKVTLLPGEFIACLCSKLRWRGGGRACQKGKLWAKNRSGLGCGSLHFACPRLGKCWEPEELNGRAGGEAE